MEPMESVVGLLRQAVRVSRLEQPDHARCESRHAIELCELALKTYEVEMLADDVAEVQRCLVRAKVLKDKRNLIVHSLYMRAEDGIGLEAAKPLRRTLGQRVTKITVVEMEATAAEMEALRSDLFRAGWNARAKVTGMTRFPRQATPAGEPVTES
ncbi:hypothetical protein ABZS86_22250 [Streptomyces sp. NPDC005355]|uniref:hypothetical protein n=1 Tax=Streptomyces sp. NPDC005355 TaxID=3157038 RepID=UPI0033BD69AD